jgi:hypothetical protein
MELGGGPGCWLCAANGWCELGGGNLDSGQVEEDLQLVNPAIARLTFKHLQPCSQVCALAADSHTEEQRPAPARQINATTAVPGWAEPNLLFNCCVPGANWRNSVAVQCR